jgi:CRP-like cAMP-binding protein
MKATKFNNYLEVDGFSRMRDIFLERGEVRVLEKDEYFVREGQRTGLSALVETGAFRHLVEYTDGYSERITGYSFAGDILSDFTEFQTQHSAVSIQAVRESKIYVLPIEELGRELSWELRYQIAAAARADIYGRLLLLYRNTPQERYAGLIEHYPDILNEVSLREIASFLLVTPETLSRIRKKMLK